MKNVVNNERWLSTFGVWALLVYGQVGELAAQQVESTTFQSPISLIQVEEVDEIPGVSRLILDDHGLEKFRHQSVVRLSQFPIGVSVNGQTEFVSLTLLPISVTTPETRFVSQVQLNLQEQLPAPEVFMLGGRVDGELSSSVFLSFSPHGTYGWIHIDNALKVISSGPAGGDRSIVIFDEKRVPAGLNQWADFACDVVRKDNPPAVAHARIDGYYDCRKVKIAVETDYEYTGWLFSGNQTAAQAYIVTLIGAASQLFTSQMNLKYELTFVRLWPTANDPWTANNNQSQVIQFQEVWNATMTGVDRHLAHFLSGRQLGGGSAYLGGLCSGYGYALSSNLNGFFPYPLQNNHPWNWDIKVFAHENGHVFGAVHTHELCPPIDQCAAFGSWGPCQNAQICTSAGTIMSYCQTCPGGMSNIVLVFDEVNLATMDENLSYWSTVPYCAMLCIANDFCSAAPLLLAGVHPFNTLEANTQGPDEPAACGGSGSASIERDIWFKFLAQCTGTAAVNLCDANYDAKIAAYSSSCPTMPDQAIACSDDVCGLAPQISFPVTSNTVYRLRIGGNGDVGSGTMVINCVPSPPPCPGDVTLDGNVNVADLLALINAWGACTGCASDLNGDSQVNVADMLIVINSWGSCP